VTLANGTRLGPYEIVSLLGAGGMGEVYRANDTRLNRTVAVKILLAGRGANEQLRARFEREARAISALSHPHICALYDVGHEGDTEYLVMEYLEGETLAERIARGPLPLSHVLRFGAQIAEGLQQAHRAGITHRDLKPGNIMLAGTGAKLLDFGLAKLVDPAGGGLLDPNAPTVRVDPLSAAGTIVGTYPYMSPEQIEGHALDHRSDIFSLGAVLYEMATGRRPFQGGSPASIMAAILSADPAPVRSLQPTAPAALERIILTALEKNPDERWQTAQDVARQLRWLGESSSSMEQAAASSPPPRRSPAIAIAATALAVAALTWGATRLLSPAPGKARTVRLHLVAPPELEPLRSYDTSFFSISADGQTLCYVGRSGATRALFLRPLDSFNVTKVEGTDGAASPFWSSDGQWIAFSAGGKLWKVKLAGGGSPQEICEAPPPGTIGSWRNGTILFTGPRNGAKRQIFRVPEAGGKPVAVTSLQSGEWRHSWPWLLPDGEHFLFVSLALDTLDRQLILGSLSSPKRAVLLSNVSQARVVGKDELIYVREAKLMRQRFDVAKGTTIGEPELIADDVAYFHPSARGDFDASENGTIVYRTDTSKARLVLLDRKGTETRLVDDKEIFFNHALSPDGRKAAVSIMTRATGLCDIWIYDLTRAVRERLTDTTAVAISPVWTPDGRAIVYSETQGGGFPHIVLRPLATLKSEDLVPRGPFLTARSFSPDGETLFYEQIMPSRGVDIYNLAMKTRTATPFLGTKFDEGEPEVSPDGKWLAFSSNPTGTMEVYVQNLTDGSERIRISTARGENPRWRRDGKELFFVSPAGSVMSATQRSPGRWDDPILTELFRLPTKAGGFAVTPDGQSFLISYVTPGPGDSLFHVVMDGR
jgi:serine/threonine protein kinase